MKVIKKFWVPIFIVCFLLLGYVIGQWRNSINAEKELGTEVSNVSEVVSQKDTSVTPSENDQNGSDAVSGEEWEGLHLSFENISETADNPWGITSGLIDVDDVGKCILLTPNTSFTIKDLTSESLISLEAEIHPWVADSSDGAGIDVWIMDENGEILKKDKISIVSGATWASIQYSIGDVADATQIKFLCNNGNADDDSCDWVILRIFM